ncbi:uncharacterized protein LOC121776482 [Salvia splendens]|uniref:uncharacterized protein LOC121776482 n=1 Tax=Salvia splendens TaxID=180675 RepID=UPI001C25404F|nr:uncharacterized protein LOC121776482 [Salvia splendens]
MGRIVVHDENVWNERLKANPKIAPYRKRITVENWDDICTLFSQDRADGQCSKTFQENTNEEVDFATVGESLDMSVEEANAMTDLVARKNERRQHLPQVLYDQRRKCHRLRSYLIVCTDFSDYLMVEKNKSELVVEQKKLDIEQKKLIMEKQKKR